MRVVVVGTGRIGSRHLATLAADPRVDEVLIVDTDRARASSLERDGVAPVPHLRSALARGVDAAVVATPAGAHAADVVRLLVAGVPTFCEKPLTLDLASLDEIGAAASSVPLVVGFQRRFDTAYRALRVRCEQLRDRGEAAFLYRLSTGDRCLPPGAFLSTAGGIFHDMLIHDFDVIDFLSPSPVVAVTARTAAGPLDGAGDDGVAVVTAELADGGLVVVTGSRSTGSGYETTASVNFPSETVALGAADDRSPYVHVDTTARGVAWQGFEDRFAAAYTAEIAHFLDVATRRARPEVGVREARSALALADAAAASAASGERVALHASLGA